MADILEAYRWPLVVFGLAVIAVVVFREQIAGLLGRSRKVPTPFGALIVDQELPDDVQEFVGGLQEVLQAQRADLEEKQRTIEEWQGLATQYSTGWWYEQTYRVIFGSQIALLQRLNVSRAGAVADELDVHYQLHLALARIGGPAYRISREQYLNFLCEAGLVEAEGDRYRISEWGRGFLVYLIQAGISPFKPY
jgi:hypothetical protein